MHKGVSILFGLLVGGFVLQWGISEAFREPYPGLFQPGFGSAPSAGGGVTIQEPMVVVAYEGGRSVTFSHREIMAQAKVLPSAVFSSAFGPGSSRGSDPETIAWLERRLTDLGNGREPEQAVIEWSKVSYDLDDELPPTSVTDDRTVISFGETRG